MNAVHISPGNREQVITKAIENLAYELRPRHTMHRCHVISDPQHRAANMIELGDDGAHLADLLIYPMEMPALRVIRHELPKAFPRIARTVRWTSRHRVGLAVAASAAAAGWAAGRWSR